MARGTARASDDLGKALRGMNIPIVILGLDGQIVQCSPAAEKMFHLAGETGWPASQSHLALVVPDLADLAAITVETGKEIEREIQVRGRWHMTRIGPYRTTGAGIDGVLLTMVDIHDLKERYENLKRKENFVSVVLDAARHLLVVVLDREGRIVGFNRACQELTGYARTEIEGRILWDFLLVPEEIEEVKGIFRQLVDGRIVQSQNHWITRDGRRRLVAWSAGVTRGASGAVEFVVRTGVDITERQEARQQARESEATVRALLETAAQAIIVVGRDGRIAMVNAAAETMFGYSREELIGLALEKLIPPQFRALHIPHRHRYFREARPRPMGLGMDLSGLRKDGIEFPVEISLSHIETGDGNLAVSFISDITERKRAEDALRASQAQLRALTASLLEAQEQERRRLSRELHDDLNQKLAMLSVEVGQIEGAVSGAMKERLAALGMRLSALTDEVRRTAYQLHPSVLEHLGLVAALESYCADFSRQESIDVGFRKRHVPASLPQATALCLYRVTQESLRNVARHSGASRALVSLSGSRNDIVLRISDNGRGFDVAAMHRRGLGLVSMEERVRTVGGTLTISTHAGDGTRIEVRIPLSFERNETAPASAG